MNLGNAMLRSVACTRPQLAHTPSRQSIAASEDYKSFSDYASEADSSLDDRTTVLRWHTPPSHNRSNTGLENAQSEATLSVHRHKHDRSSVAVPLGVRFNEADLKMLEPTKTTVAPTKPTKPTESDTSPPTPGTDDTPYIRFAIEQLTRSPDASGSKRPASQSSEETYPVARIIPDEGLGYMKKKELNNQDSFHSEDPLPSESFEEPETFLPVERPGESYLHPELDFVPGILRPMSLVSLLIVCLLMVGALVFCFTWSRQDHGLSDYRADSNGQYFVFGYLPQLIAGLLVLILIYVENTILRIMPFTAMSSTKASLRSKALFMDLFKTNFLLPRLNLFKAANPLVAGCLVVFWLSVFTVPLQSSLFQVRPSDAGGHSTWRWVAVEPVLWTLVGIWSIIAASVLALCFYFVGRRTGLKWDPVSLADIFTLLQRSNSLADYSGSETFEGRQAFQDKLGERADRLGYWRTTKSDDVFYTIAEEGAETRRYSIQQGKIKEKAPEQFADRIGYDIEGQRPLRSVTNESLREKIFSPGVRYRTVPWFLRDTYVVAWTVVSFVLLLAFLIISFFRQGVKRGFRPLVDTTTNSIGFSPGGFLYSFIPSLLGMVLFLSWQSVDMYFRALQPFAKLANPNGASAADSLLLDYTSCLPVVVTTKAVVFGHWKVAWISFISLLSLALPILGGGVFWAEYFPNIGEVRMAGRMGGFYTLVAVLILYVLSLLIIWPRWKRYLPHDICTLAELISFVYQSPVLTDTAFQDPRGKTDLVTRLLSNAPGESVPGRYAFGVYFGQDGKEHLGVDRLQRRHYTDMLVTTGGRM